MGQCNAMHWDACEKWHYENKQQHQRDRWAAPADSLFKAHFRAMVMNLRHQRQLLYLFVYLFAGLLFVCFWGRISSQKWEGQKRDFNAFLYVNNNNNNEKSKAKFKNIPYYHWNPLVRRAKLDAYSPSLQGSLHHLLPSTRAVGPS